ASGELHPALWDAGQAAVYLPARHARLRGPANLPHDVRDPTAFSRPGLGIRELLHRLLLQLQGRELDLLAGCALLRFGHGWSPPRLSYLKLLSIDWLVSAIFFLTEEVSVLSPPCTSLASLSVRVSICRGNG